MLEPLQIGALLVPGRCFAAPMAGVSDWPFRLLCRELGAALTYTEFASAEGIVRGNDTTLRMIERGPGESPFAIQIYGADEGALAEAAAICAERGADLVDINLGCPVPKVVSSGAGSAALREPDKIGRMAARIRAAMPARVPLTLKMRSGWDAQHITCIEVSQAAEAAGVAAVALHARTRDQQYSGSADWDLIGRLKSSLKIPVIGNGDVRSAADALRMRQVTGCDAVMIARACCGNPWIFAEVAAAAHGETLPRLDRDAWRGLILRHLALEIEAGKPEVVAVREMRRHLVWYVSGRRGALDFRREVPQLLTASDVARALEVHFPSEPSARAA